MAVSVSSSTTINQPVEKVFDYVTNVANHPAWQAGIQNARISPEGPVNLGSVYTYTSEVMGRKMDTNLQVTQFEANKTWGISTTGMPNPVLTLYSFEDAGGTTKLTITMELSGGFPAAAEGMIKAQTEKSVAEQTARIKQLAEG
jgi:uncharacterized protein YndB with AHSA1/START domain